MGVGVWTRHSEWKKREDVFRILKREQKERREADEEAEMREAIKEGDGKDMWIIGRRMGKQGVGPKKRKLRKPDMQSINVEELVKALGKKKT